MTTLKEILRELGIEIDSRLFELAMTHRSYAYEAGGIPSNERLEFLGDAVLEIVVTDYLYRNFPDMSEGELAKLRSSVVSAVSLAEIARTLAIGSMIMLGKGEIATGGHDKKSILADTTEALIGAIYLSQGLQAATSFILHIYRPLIQDLVAAGEFTDYKTIIQELSARNNWKVQYCVEGSGPDHQREYRAVLLINGEARGEGTATNRRRAEQLAARQAVSELGDA